MLKLTEDLFRMHPSAKYADYYERTCINHILSTQNPDNGGYVYFTPVRPEVIVCIQRLTKRCGVVWEQAWRTMVNTTSLFIRMQHDSLYVNLFIASELNWKEKGIRVKQETKFPFEEKTKLIITEGNSAFKLMVRYPSWVKDGDLKIMVNGKPFAITNHPSTYIAIDRTWKKGDVVEIALPMHNTIEHLPNVSNYIAILHGPVLLGAKTGTEDLKGLIADDSRWGHIPSGEKLPVDKAPIIIEDDINRLTTELVPVKDKPLNFTIPAVKLENPIDVKLQPFYQIHDARYMVYWMALSNHGYKTYLDSIISY